MAPLFALLNNVLELRLDAQKILRYYRRPVPYKVPSIGVWYRIFDIIGKMAVIFNVREYSMGIAKRRKSLETILSFKRSNFQSV